MNRENLGKLISEAIAIEAEDAKEGGTLGYMARTLVQATMPHKNPHSSEAWGRRNGNFSMIIQPGFEMDKKNNPRCIGLPYGTKPRLVMAFISSEAVKKRNKEIVLGKSLSEFMRQLGLTPTGGRWGTIPMLREQMKRLFSSTISFQYEGDSGEVRGGLRIASRLVLFWEKKTQTQSTLWESTITLTQEFYDEIVNRPVPINMRALAAIKDSSLALDILLAYLPYELSQKYR